MMQSWWRRLPPAVFGRAVALATAAQLGVAGTALAEEGGGGGNPWMALAWKAVNLAVLLGLIWYFGRKPIGAMFRGAAKQAREALEERRAQASGAQAQLADQRRRIEGLEAELERMAAEARAEAQSEHERLVNEARAQAERIKTTVGMQVEQELAKARKELQAELANDTVRLAEEMIRQRMDDDSRKRVVSRAIDQLGAGS